jgi:hypothetical protein
VWETCYGKHVASGVCTVHEFIEPHGFGECLSLSFNRPQQNEVVQVFERYAKYKTLVPIENGTRAFFPNGIQVVIKVCRFPHAPMFLKDKTAVVLSHDKASGVYTCHHAESRCTFKVDRESVHQIVSGVVLCGLVTSAHLNGRIGTVRDRHECGSRVYFQFEGEETTISVKTSNILFPPGTRIVFLARGPLFRKNGIVVVADLLKQRYHIGFDTDIFKDIISEVTPEMVSL